MSLELLSQLEQKISTSLESLELLNLEIEELTQANEQLKQENEQLNERQKEWEERLTNLLGRFMSSTADAVADAEEEDSY